MKRLYALAIMAAFILGTVGIAQAVEIKAGGVWRVSGNWIKNPDFNSDVKNDDFNAWQRLRTQFQFIASENLKGVLELEIGNFRWGQGGPSERPNNVKTRFAFIDFKLPNTDVNTRAGVQLLTLPNTFGSHILWSEAGAVVVNAPLTDMVGLTLGWGRLWDRDTVSPEDTTEKWDDEVDVFMAVLPVTLDGLKLSPFAVYTRLGKESGFYGFAGQDSPKNANMWHGGLNFNLSMLDPIVIKGDLNYGTVKWAENYKQSGWVGVLAAEYKMDMVTPQLFGFWETGESSTYATGDDSKRMPVIHTTGGAFGPGVSLGWNTSFAADSFLRILLAGTDQGGYQDRDGAIGMWAVGAALRNITFMDQLSHDLVAFYGKGTNDEANVGLMTKKDTYWEANFNSRYKLYENLSLILELAYANVSLDQLNVGQAREDLAKDNLYRGVLGIVYSF